MTEYRRALPQEESDLLDFINMVFSQASCPHDFARLLPKVYAHAGFSKYHMVAVEEGKIRATVAVLPMELKVDERCSLKVGYVGSVSVHPCSRGAGHMKALMKRVISESEAQGYDLLALGGQRQRYGYFGFENGGTHLTFSIGAANIRHTMKSVNAENVRIRLITDKDDAAIPAIEDISSCQAMCCVRAHDRFFDIMHSWQGQLYALEDMRVQGTVMGYLYAQGDHIWEMALNDECRVREVIKSFMASRDHMRITVLAFHRVRANFIKSFAEGFEIGDNEMFRIFNWRHALEGLLGFKAGVQPLCDGKFVFEVESAGRYAVTVRDHEVMVMDTQETPDMCFTKQRAVEFFFSPFSAYMTSSPILSSWLPVPLDIPSPDGF